jgi:hypothetical protein
MKIFFQLSTSSGGGCCDCGDEEAWRQGASCELHSAKSEDSAGEVGNSMVVMTFFECQKLSEAIGNNSELKC